MLKKFAPGPRWPLACKILKSLSMFVSRPFNANAQRTSMNCAILTRYNQVHSLCAVGMMPNSP